MNKIKNLKMYTKFLIFCGVIDLAFLITLILAYSGAQKALASSDPAEFLSRFNIQLGFQFIMVVMIMIGFGVHLGRTIRKSVANLRKAASEIASGNVDIQLEKLYEDEFGEVIDDFQKVIENMHYEADVAEQVAEGNMSIEVKRNGDKDALGNALARMIEKNHYSLSNIKDAASYVSSSSSEVASAAESLAQGSTGQASAIQEITASIDDIADKTKKNAGEANKVADMMSNAIVDVKHGNEQMQNMTVAMEEINKASEGISKIIKVIDDIAFQTNILALNAAVEAARAGEAGKGFAVVAEEVRNLAAKSAAAAAETAEMIEDSIQKVGIGSEIVQETAKALEKITNIVQESESMITGIAEASNYQATAIAQIDQAVEQVSQVVQTNSATSEECAAASVELSKQAERMQELLKQYQLKDMDSNGKKAFKRVEKNDHEEFGSTMIKQIYLGDE